MVTVVKIKGGGIREYDTLVCTSLVPRLIAPFPPRNEPGHEARYVPTYLMA